MAIKKKAAKKTSKKVSKPQKRIIPLYMEKQDLLALEKLQELLKEKTDNKAIKDTISKYPDLYATCNELRQQIRDLNGELWQYKEQINSFREFLLFANDKKQDVRKKKSASFDEDGDFDQDDDE